MKSERRTGYVATRSVLIILFALVIGATAYGSNIYGRVLCEDGTPIPGVQVNAYACDGLEINSSPDGPILTDSDGAYVRHVFWRQIGDCLTMEYILPDGQIIVHEHIVTVKPIIVDDIIIDCEEPEPCSECKGKITVLTLLYTGPNATVTVAQKVGKRDTGDGVLFEGALVTGEEFTVVGTAKDGTLGTEISLFIDDALNTKIHTSCSRPIYPGMESGLFVVVEAYSLEGGLICALGDTPGNGCECDGGVTQLTFQYIGNSDDLIVVLGKGKRDKKTGEVIYPIIFFEDGVNDIVSDDGVFTLIGSKGKDDKLGTEILIFVGDDLNTTLHTSCSRPIGIGMEVGDFVILEGSSVKGGDLCPL